MRSFDRDRLFRFHGRVAARRAAIRIGIDTGGTFTDIVLFDGKRFLTHKLPSTPADPARAVLAGLREVLAPFADDDRDVWIHYGSTVATNAVLERKGARVALLTTAGFEDVVEIGRQTRPRLYALEPRRPEPLVPRSRRLGVRERMLFGGRALVPLTGAEVRRALREVRRVRAESVAICLLHSYANPGHEHALARALRAAGYTCSASNELVAEYREYERFSTTVLNAYVAPVMGRHLKSLQDGIARLERRRGASRAATGRRQLRVMQSSGGLLSAPTAAREAVRTLLSGPAGGVIGAAGLAARLGIERLITLDMGGTSTDVSLVDGRVRRHTEWEVEGFPVKTPAIDIHTVGAGGGSLAWIDPGGALRVGPESAGADPGPACYGRGERATVTDADLVLGRLVPESFLGGRMTLDVGRARSALARLGRSLGLDAEAMAEGVVRVVNAGMERAIRRVSVERGHDPREYTLVAFGGAAGMHACELAAALGCPRVLVPPNPGLWSAWGALGADVQRDFVQTVRRVRPSFADLRRLAAPLVRRARREMGDEAPGRAARVEIGVDVRYQGQSHEVCVPLTNDYAEAFHVQHERLYGYRDDRRPVEVVNLRVTAFAKGVAVAWSRPRRQPPRPRSRRVRWNGHWHDAVWHPRDALPARLTGPALITELSSTTFVPPGWSVRATVTGELFLTRVEVGPSPRRLRGRGGLVP